MGRASRISAVLCFGFAAVAAAACSGDDTTPLLLELDPTVTQVFPFDTATSGGGDIEADTVTAADPSHLCPPDVAGSGAGDGEQPPLPPCSTDPVIQ